MYHLYVCIVFIYIRLLCIYLLRAACPAQGTLEKEIFNLNVFFYMVKYRIMIILMLMIITSIISNKQCEMHLVCLSTLKLSEAHQTSVRILSALCYLISFCSC